MKGSRVRVSLLAQCLVFMMVLAQLRLWLLSPFAERHIYAEKCKILSDCGNSSVGRAQPCQGWGREFESRFPLTSPAYSGSEMHLIVFGR